MQVTETLCFTEHAIPELDNLDDHNGRFSIYHHTHSVSLLTAVSVVYSVYSPVEQRSDSLLSLLVYSHSDSALSGVRGLI